MLVIKYLLIFWLGIKVNVKKKKLGEGSGQILAKGVCDMIRKATLEHYIGLKEGRVWGGGYH